MSRQKSLACFLAAPENQSALLAAKDLLKSLEHHKNPSVNPLYLHGPPGSGKTHLVEMFIGDLTRFRRDLTMRMECASELHQEEVDGLRECDVFVLEDLQHLRPQSEEWLI